MVVPSFMVGKAESVRMSQAGMTAVLAPLGPLPWDYATFYPWQFMSLLFRFHFYLGFKGRRKDVAVSPSMELPQPLRFLL